MRPPQRNKTEFEKLPADEWINGVIQDIQYEPEYKREFKGETKVGPALRFKFAFEGCVFPHYSRWMSFSTGEKSNIYKKYLINLIQDAKPDMDIEMDLLKGMKIKTMWSNNGDFQNLEMIRPVGDKIKIEEEIPF